MDLHEKNNLRTEDTQATTPLNVIAAVIIFIVASGVYVNTLSHEFVYDDGEQVLQNPWIKDVRTIPSIFTSSVWSFLPDKFASNYYRPMMHMIYMLNFHVFGLKSWGFHLTNVLLHASVSTMIFIITRNLLQAMQQALPGLYKRVDGRVVASSFAAALLFATHPIHAEVVAWIAGVPDLSYTLFFLLSFYSYMKMKDGNSWLYVTSVILFALATLSKEPALTLPFILMAYDYTFNPPRDWVANGHNVYTKLKRYIPYFAVAVFYLVMRSYALGGFSPQEPHNKLNAYGYIINVFPLFARYLEKLLLPIGLNAFYVFHPINSAHLLRGIVSIVVFAAFIAVLVYSFKKNRPVFFSMVVVSLPILPVLYIPALGINVFAERYLYLPSFGYCLLIALAIFRISSSRPRSIAIMTAVILAVTSSYAVGTMRRNNVWADNMSLFSDTVKKSPDAAQIHNDLGIEYWKKKRFHEAINEYEAAIRLKPDFPESYVNMGNVYLDQGRTNDAINRYDTALRLRSNYYEGHNNLGNAYLKQNRLNEAISEYVKATELMPGDVRAHNDLGAAYLLQGSIDKAIAEFHIALQIEPGNVLTHGNLGTAYAIQERFVEAIAEFQTALLLKPDYDDARKNLEICYQRMKDLRDAVR